jgi:hypothetical protein
MVELVYALIQAIHNLGAFTLVAVPAAALAWQGRSAAVERHFSWTLLAAWGLQAAGGAAFAAASYGFKGQVPEVAGVALAALGVKVAAAVAGFGLAAVQLWRDRRAGTANWVACLLLAVVATTAAAFLRWYL